MKKIENRGIDQGLFLEIVQAMDDIPVVQSTKMRIKYLQAGGAGVEMLVIRDFENSRGLLHGGLIATLADTAMGLSMLSLNIRGLTLELNINYLAPVEIGSRLTAQARVIHAGENSLVVEADVYDQRQNLVAKSRGTFFMKA
ncbi:MAG: PaaI family thioesterase [Syntrophomonadaceae bacterium]|nr:PaaI family thioesterase [Syntrophomonadaceae bacterium]